MAAAFVIHGANLNNSTKAGRLGLNVTGKKALYNNIQKYARTLLTSFGFVSCAKYVILLGHK